MKVAGNGDPATAPKELVAILGESASRVGMPVRNMQFSADGKQLAVARGSRMVRIDAATGRQIGVFPGESTRDFHLDRGWTKIAVSEPVRSAEPDVEVWDVESGKQLYRLGEKVIGHFSPDGKKIAVSPFSQPVQILDSADGAKLATLKLGGGMIGFAAKGKEVVTFGVVEGAGQVFYVSDWESEKKLRDLPTPHLYPRITLSPDGSID